MTVYVAWGFQGDSFTIHDTWEHALQNLKSLAVEYGEDPDLVTGESGVLDGFYVEEFDLLG